MARWEPDARGRLERAALELIAELGYDQATTAGIAERAGLSERTFFRHFLDKREALFSGADELVDLVVAEVTVAPAGTSPLDAVVHALGTTSPLFERRRATARTRDAVIASHPALRERELTKLSTLSTAVAHALCERGVDAATARLAADAGVAILSVAYEAWAQEPERTDFTDHVTRAHGRMAMIVGTPPSA